MAAQTDLLSENIWKILHHKYALKSRISIVVVSFVILVPRTCCARKIASSAAEKSN